MITDVGLKTDWLLLSKSCESWDIHLFFFYTVGEPGYAVLMQLIIWKSWPTYIVIHCCRKGEYIGTPITLFLPRSYFADSREFDGHILLHCPRKECFMLLDKLFLLSFILLWLSYVDVSRVIHNTSITYRYLGLVSELGVIEKTIFFSFLITKLYISLTLVISICNVARDGSSTREQTITEWQRTSFKS